MMRLKPKQTYEVNIPKIHVVLEARSKDKAIKNALKDVALIAPHIRTMIRAGKIHTNPFWLKFWVAFWSLVEK